MGLNVSLNCGIRSQIIMLFVHVLFCCCKSIFISVFVVCIIEGLFKIFSLFFQRLKLTGSNHGIDMCDIAEWIAWKTVDHFGIRKYWLTDCDWVVGISKLDLTMSEYTSYTDGTRLWSLPMSTESGFIFLIEQWVHNCRIWISYNYKINRSLIKLRLIKITCNKNKPRKWIIFCYFSNQQNFLLNFMIISLVNLYC